MVKHTRRRSHRSKRGGSNYTSAASYGSYVAGSLDDQYNRTFSQTGPNAANQSNILVGAQGQNSNLVGMPTANELSTVQSAGRRRRKRGGFLGQVINQAIVPFSLLGLQQSYKRKKYGGKKTRRHSRRKH